MSAPNYAALIAVWNTAGLPAGASGTPLASGMSAAQKMAAIDGWTVVVPQPAILTGAQILNVITPAAYVSLSPSQLGELQPFVSAPQVDASIGTATRADIQAIIGGDSASLANFAALLAPFDNATASWLTSNGLPPSIGTGDLANAGLS